MVQRLQQLAEQLQLLEELDTPLAHLLLLVEQHI